MTEPTGHPAPADAAHELIDWVDAQDRVLAVVPRARMRLERLAHRAVYIVVLDRVDQVVVHQRAGWKDLWPNRWDVAFGGVVAAGERYEDAALRELAEEAGLAAPRGPVGRDGVHGAGLAPLGEPFRYRDDDVDLHGRAYWLRTEASLSCPDGEVAALDRVPRGELARWAATHQVCPDSRQCVLPLIEQLTKPG